MAETSTKPYMIRALYEWCCDNGYTPYLAVTVDQHTLVPRQHVKGGEIVLNVSPMATSRLSLGNELVEFQARFSGVAQQISVPVGNVSAIYARETGQGMAFEVTPAPGVQGRDAAQGTAPDPDGEASSGSDDEGGVHAPGSTVQSLRGGSRRRGPRSAGREDSAGGGGGADVDAVRDGEEGAGGARGEDSEGAGRSGASAPAANSRRRSTKGQGSADVLAFTPSGGQSEKKKGPVAVTTSPKAGNAGDPSSIVPPNPPEGADDDDPPPADGGGKGGKARLTRVK